LSLENERLLVQSRAENVEMQCRLNESKARTQELLEDKHVWVSENGNLESEVAELQTKLDSIASERRILCQKNRELSTEVESLKAELHGHNARLAHLEDERKQNESALYQCRTEKIVLESKLNESKERIHDLLRKIEQDGHLWDKEKRNLEVTLLELQTNLELMASESGSMSKKIIELIIEVEFLKTQENEYNATLVCMEDERHALNAESSSNEERLQSLLTKIATNEYEINSLRSQRNEILQEEVDSTKGLLQTQNQRLQELDIALNEDIQSKEPQLVLSTSARKWKIKTKWFDRNWKAKPKWFASK
jgi:chromosome segregation ATPase